MQDRDVQRTFLCIIACIPEAYDLSTKKLFVSHSYHHELSIHEIRCNIIRLPIERLELIVRRNKELRLPLSVVDPETPDLSFIIEIQSVDCSSVVNSVKAFHFLRSVNVSKKRIIERCCLEDFSRKDRIEVGIAACLAGFDVASRYGVVRHEDGLFCGALGTKARDNLSDLFCPYLILFICRQPRELSPEFLFVESRNDCEVCDPCCYHARFCHDDDSAVPLQHLLKYTELSGSVVVRCAPHDDDQFCRLSKLCDDPRCGQHLIGVADRSYLLLMEDVAGDTYDIRMLCFRSLDHVLKALDRCLISEIHSFFVGRTFERPQMPISSMQ